MKRSEIAAEQTGFRRQLLANGYTPLANDDKRCMLPGWPTLAVDKQQIAEWAEQLRYLATGVRVEPPLAVIDVDIDDACVIDEILDVLPDEISSKLETAPERYGKGEKVAWFIRADKPFGRIASAAFVDGPDPEAEDAVLERIECFGGTSARQFGAYGAHTVGRDKVEVWYGWTDADLTETPLDTLPELTQTEIEKVCDVASEVMAGRGWSRHERSKTGHTVERVVYDLHDSMVFETREDGERSLDELRELADAAGSVRLSASWLEGPGARNTTRCIASLDASGGLQIYETAEGVVHKPESADPELARRTAIERLAELTADMDGGDFFSEAPGDGEAGSAAPEGRAVYEQTVALLLRDYAFWPAENAVVPIRGGAPMQPAAFKRLMANCTLTEVGPRGGITVLNPADDWWASPDRIDVIGQRFVPRSREDLVWVDDPDGASGWAVNLYRPAVLDAAAARGDVWHAFLAHLLPHEEEREWFRMWLAAKAQRPWQPSCAVLMHTTTQGTGRGTLFDMLRGIFGDRHCATVSAMQLFGDGGQSQYNDWLERALMVFCDELLAGDDTSVNQGWKRRNAYERLKTFFDPRPAPVQIVRKGYANYEGRSYASFLIASNNPNALPVSEEDRRVAVLRNTATKLEHAEAGALVDGVRDAWGLGFDPGFLRAVYEDLMSVEVDWPEVFNAPDWFEGRADMIAANETDLEHLVIDTMAKVPGDYILARDLKRRLSNAMRAAELDEPKWWSRARDMLLRPNRSGWTVLRGGARLWATAKDATPAVNAPVYARDAGPGLDGWESTPYKDRPALWELGSDLNETLTRAREALRDGRFSVLDGDAGAGDEEQKPGDEGDENEPGNTS